jgi:acetolactate synthase-1/3 small subunit
MRRILAVLLENEAGSLSRIVGLFSQRAFNIESLTVAPTDDDSLSRIKVLAMNEKSRSEVKRITDIFRGSVIDIGKQVYTIQLTGNAEKINAFISTLANETEIIESVRSGCVGIARGEKSLSVK